MWKLIFLTSLFTLIASWEDTDELTVQINDGKILGRYMTSRLRRPVRSFRGIPFAEPPVGDLRFKAPQRVKPWEGVKITQNDGPICTQINPFGRIFDVVTGEEDCLYLNVYTPARRSNQSEKLPVIYFIHGGGWTRGEASNFAYGHDHMLDHDIILVLGNYRVGPIGFLSTEDKNSPGNFAFKDQNLILQWIQENIEHFGGDKNSVTIWGESAGAASVNYHMISPLSKGLFHRAISHSGALMECWSDVARRGQAKEQGIRLAKELNCPTLSMEEMVNCLRNVPASNLTLSIANLYYWDYDPVILFLPVVEDFESDEEKFISSRDPIAHSPEIPWLVGMNSDENLLKLAAILENKSFYDELMEKWDQVLPYSFYYFDIASNLQSDVTKTLNKFYFGSEDHREVETQSLIDLFTDGWFIGFYEALKNRFSRNFEATYVYLFSHKSTASYSATSTYYGTSHVDDLIPFFPMRKNFFFSSKPTIEDQELARVLPEMWINFAKTGNPNMPASSNIPQWPKATSLPFHYMKIGNQNGKSGKLFEVGYGLYEDRANFWMELRANYSLNRWN